MSDDQILRKWRKHLAEKLQDRYGLRAEDARKKAGLWLRSVEVQPAPSAQLDRGWAPDHGNGSAKSRSAAATRL